MQQWRSALCVMTLVATAFACSSEPSGGADDLPGDLPSDVVFVEAPADAPPAPAISGELIDGTPVDGADLWEDRPVVLVFTASWCGRCGELHEEIADVVAGHEGVTLVGLVDESDEDAAGYAEELGVDSPLVVVPTTTWDAYAADEPPLVALVGPGGALLRGWPGGVDPEVLSEQLDGLVDTGGDG